MFGWNLTRYQHITLGQMMSALDFPEVSEPVYFQVDGSDAVRNIVRGATSGLQLSYVRGIIDAPTAFIQLLGWTSRSGWDENRPTLDAIVASASLLH